MRAAILLCSGCILLASPGYSVPLKPGNTDESAMKLEAIGDRSPEQWQGRQHYLYDEDHPPSDEETVGSAGSDRRDCVDEPVRMKRSDGKTVVRRLNRC